MAQRHTLTRYGDHVSGLDHSEPVWVLGKKKPATCEGSGLWGKVKATYSTGVITRLRCVFP